MKNNQWLMFFKQKRVRKKVRLEKIIEKLGKKYLNLKIINAYIQDML